MLENNAYSHNHRQGHEKGFYDADGQKKYLSAEELGSMLALLEEVDRERKVQVI